MAGDESESPCWEGGALLAGRMGGVLQVRRGTSMLGERALARRKHGGKGKAFRFGRKGWGGLTASKGHVCNALEYRPPLRAAPRRGVLVSPRFCATTNHPEENCASRRSRTSQGSIHLDGTSRPTLRHLTEIDRPWHSGEKNVFVSQDEVEEVKKLDSRKSEGRAKHGGRILGGSR